MLSTAWSHCSTWYFLTTERLLLRNSKSLNSICRSHSRSVSVSVCLSFFLLLSLSLCVCSFCLLLSVSVPSVSLSLCVCGQVSEVYSCCYLDGSMTPEKQLCPMHYRNTHAPVHCLLGVSDPMNYRNTHSLVHCLLGVKSL